MQSCTVGSNKGVLDRSRDLIGPMEQLSSDQMSVEDTRGPVRPKSNLPRELTSLVTRWVFKCFLALHKLAKRVTFMRPCELRTEARAQCLIHDACSLTIDEDLCL